MFPAAAVRAPLCASSLLAGPEHGLAFQPQYTMIRAIRTALQFRAVGQFEVAAALRRHLAIPPTRDRRYDTGLTHYPVPRVTIPLSRRGATCPLSV